jgi:hypothetical protein
MESSLLINARKFREPISRQGLDQGILFCDQKNKGLTVGKIKERSSEENKCFQNFYRLEKRQGAP